MTIWKRVRNHYITIAIVRTLIIIETLFIMRFFNLTDEYHLYLLMYMIVFILLITFYTYLDTKKHLFTEKKKNVRAVNILWKLAVPLVLGFSYIIYLT